MNESTLYDIASIMLQKKGRVLVPVGKYDSKDNLEPVVATMAHILLSRGVLLSDELVKGLLNTKMSAKEMASYCEAIIQAYDSRIAYRFYKPFYAGFPNEVMQADEATLVINAILHYVSGGAIVPNTNFAHDVVAPVSQLFDRVINITNDKLCVLQPCTMEDFYVLCNNMMTSRTSISAYDKDILNTLIDCDCSRVPADMPHKENKAVVIAALLRKNVFEHPLYNQTNSATDVLRIATALSDGDVSLKENTYYISFPRPIRKWMMDTLECIPGNIAEDMMKYRERWLRIGERLHPRAFPVDEYERTIDAFDVLRNNEKAIVSYSSKVARAFEEHRFDAIIPLLTKKPGTFARELHHLFRAFPDKHYEIAVGFASVSNRVSTTVLMQIRSYYKNKCFLSDVGVYFPKGNTQRIFVKTDLPVVAINSEICNLIIIACDNGLMAQYRDRYANETNEETKVYIEPALKNCLLPTSMRSAGKSMRVIPRGSRLPWDGSRYLRAFIHWMNNECRVDVDLSVVFLDDEYNVVDRVYYHNLRNCCSVHSGDFVDAPKPGACEFIDVDLEAAAAANYRYVVVTVHSFTSDTFKDIPDCYVGYLSITEEEYNTKGNKRVFLPENVRNVLDLSSTATHVVVCAIDTARKDLIWCDVAGDDEKVLSFEAPNNVDVTKESIAYIIQSVVEQSRGNMYTLAKMTAEAKRHIIVNTPEEADVLYLVESAEIEGKTVISAFDNDVWLKMV